MIFWMSFLLCIFHLHVPFGHSAKVKVETTPKAAEVRSTVLVEPELKLLDYDVWCKLQPNTNDCSDRGYEATRYYYDTLLEGCKTFTYKDCTMSYNSFSTINECSEACREPGLHPIRANYSYKVFCRLQPDFGQCHEYHPMFYFDIGTRKCKGFSYSGCGGNNNRFPNTQTCVETCLKLMEPELNFF